MHKPHFSIDLRLATCNTWLLNTRRHDHVHLGKGVLLKHFDDSWRVITMLPLTSRPRFLRRLAFAVAPNSTEISFGSLRQTQSQLEQLSLSQRVQGSKQNSQDHTNGNWQLQVTVVTPHPGFFGDCNQGAKKSDKDPLLGFGSRRYATDSSMVLYGPSPAKPSCNGR